MSCNSLSSLESDHSLHDKTFLRQSDFPATMDFWNKKLILNILQIHATWKARGPWAKLLTWGTMFIHLWWLWAPVVSSLLSLGIQSGSNLKFKQTIYISYHLMCYYIYNIFYASFIICYYGYWQQLCNSSQIPVDTRVEVLLHTKTWLYNQRIQISPKQGIYYTVNSLFYTSTGVLNFVILMFCIKTLIMQVSLRTLVFPFSLSNNQLLTQYAMTGTRKLQPVLKF